MKILLKFFVFSTFLFPFFLLIGFDLDIPAAADKCLKADICYMQPFRDGVSVTWYKGITLHDGGLLIDQNALAFRATLPNSSQQMLFYLDQIRDLRVASGSGLSEGEAFKALTPFSVDDIVPAAADYGGKMKINIGCRSVSLGSRLMTMHHVFLQEKDLIIRGKLAALRATVVETGEQKLFSLIRIKEFIMAQE